MENERPDEVLLDVVIAVHTPDRPIERAVASLLAGGLPVGHGQPSRLRITVVCHNTEVAPIRARLPAAHRDRVRFLHHVDGIKSPAGPFNAGMAAATGQWVAIMGSDDTMEAGAPAAWLNAAATAKADVLIAPMAHAGGAAIHTPVVRTLRRNALDPVLDRLTYRTAPLGIMKTALVRRLGLTFPTAYATGEDQFFSAQLWFSGARISYGRKLPRYLVHDDAVARVTASPRSVAQDLAFATDLAASEWFRFLDVKCQHAIVTKLIRVHVFGHVALRAKAGTWDETDATYIADVMRQLLFAAPRAVRPLSLADRALVDAIVRGEPTDTVMVELAAARRVFTNPRTWLPRDLSRLLHPEAPPRFMSASALI